MIEITVLFAFCVALSMGLGALSLFIWAVLSGQMEDTEEIKYRILERELGDGRE